MSTIAISPDLLSAIVTSIRNFGGYTVDLLTGVSPASGFCVAYDKHTEHVVSESADLGAAVLSYIAQYDDWSEPVHLGAWVDDGLVYLDRPLVLDNLDRAISIGKSAAQLAIYDIAAGETVYLESEE
jgi:hypothetical protein